MSSGEAILKLFLGLLAMLALSSTIAFILKKFVAKGAPNATIDNLTARINAWWVMILVIFGFVYMGTKALIFLFLSYPLPLCANFYPSFT